MISLLLLIFYTTLFVFWLLHISRKYRNYLSARQVIAGFIIKILSGMAYGYIFLRLYHGDDTWQYHYSALVEYQKLLHHPLQFISDPFNKHYSDTSLQAMYSLGNSFWNHLDEELFVRLLAILDVFSFGHYYVNVVLLCFPVYLGHLLLFRLFTRYYPDAAPLLAAVIFYVPATVFWLSGIRKEGLIFLAVATVFYYFDRLLRKDSRLMKHVLWCIAALATMLVMRNVVFMCVVPALAGWWLCQVIKIPPFAVFAVVIAATVFLFFASGAIPGVPDMPMKVAERQHEFMLLKAKTMLPLDTLNRTPQAYLRVLPQAANHLFFRPYLTESKSLMQLFSALDIILFYLMLGLTVLPSRNGWRRIIQNPLVLACLTCAISGYLIIGYTVPFPGAFVRYKAVFEILFLCVFAVAARTDKFPFQRLLQKRFPRNDAAVVL